MDFEENQSPQEQEPQTQPDLRGFKSFNPAAKPVKTRRVGTITLGISLIGTGVLLLLNLVWDGFPLYEFAKLSPLILVLVGAEILVASVLHKDEKLRYDFLSMFICFFLIFGSIGLSILPQVAENVMAIDQIENRVKAEVERDVYEALRDEGIEDMYVGFYLYENYYPWTEKIDTTVPYSEVLGGYLSLDISFLGSFDSEEEFAKKAREVLDKLEPLNLPNPAYYFRDSDYHYSLGVDSLWEADYTAEQLVELMN